MKSSKTHPPGFLNELMIFILVDLYSSNHDATIASIADFGSGYPLVLERYAIFCPAYLNLSVDISDFMTVFTKYYKQIMYNHNQPVFLH